jgi:membrane-associated phospholipid phosphatase
MTQPAQQPSRRLVPMSLRVPVVIMIGLCALTAGTLGIKLAHGTQPTGLDNTVARWLMPALGPASSGRGRGFGQHLGSFASPFANFGGPEPMALMTALLCYCSAAMRRYRGAILLAVSVIAASALTEYVLKPLIDRTYASALSFPSGHSTAAFALATGIIVLLANPPGSRMPRSMRAVLAILALGGACAVALGLVVQRAHYFTDTVGGAAVGIGVTLSAALLLDLRVGRLGPAAAPLPAESAEPTEPTEPAQLT